MWCTATALIVSEFASQPSWAMAPHRLRVIMVGWGTETFAASGRAAVAGPFTAAAVVAVVGSEPRAGESMSTARMPSAVPPGLLVACTSTAVESST